MENKALGKGLSALISQAKEQAKPEMDKMVKEAGQQDVSAMFDITPQYLAIEKIKFNPFQPRGEYDEESLKELVSSIKEKGILQPIMVRPNANGDFEVVMGERRLRAAQKSGLRFVPAMVRETTDTETLILALIENIQRQDLNVIDEAKAFDRLAKEFDLSQEQIAQSVGKDRTTVANTLRLLKLPEAIQRSIIKEQVSMGHARALLALNSEAEQLAMAKKIIESNLSVRSVEGLVKQSNQKKPNKTKASKAKDPDIQKLEEELRGILGTKVVVEDKKGRGQVVIEYYSLDDLDRILDILRKTE